MAAARSATSSPRPAGQPGRSCTRSRAGARHGRPARPGVPCGCSAMPAADAARPDRLVPGLRGHARGRRRDHQQAGPAVRAAADRPRRRDAGGAAAAPHARADLIPWHGAQSRQRWPDELSPFRPARDTVWPGPGRPAQPGSADASPTELPPGRPRVGMDLGKPLRFALVLLTRADGVSVQGEYGAPGEAAISLRSGTGMRRFGSRHR